MRLEGRETVALPPSQAWRALHDPEVLRGATPGLHAVRGVGDRWEAAIDPDLPSAAGHFDVAVEVLERVPKERLRLHLDARGAPGTLEAELTLRLEEAAGGTSFAWSADARVEGAIARLGHRVLESALEAMAGQFFEALGRAGEGPHGTHVVPEPRSPLLALLQLAGRTLRNLLGLSRRP